jgi:hypothetical protein
LLAEGSATAHWKTNNTASNWVRTVLVLFIEKVPYYDGYTNPTKKMRYRDDGWQPLERSVSGWWYWDKPSTSLRSVAATRAQLFQKLGITQL